MDWDSIKPVISIVADVIQAGAVTTATVVGVLSLNAWRRQLIGGKRLELAEEALVAAHDVYDAIRTVRNSKVFRDEGLTRNPQEGETEEQTRMRNAYFVPIERLREFSGRFERLRAMKTRCRVHFGDEVLPHFNKLAASEIRIASAARMLIQTCGACSPSTKGPAKQEKRQIDEWNSIVWNKGTAEAPDEFDQCLIEALAALDKVLNPHIKNG